MRPLLPVAGRLVRGAGGAPGSVPRKGRDTLTGRGGGVRLLRRWGGSSIFGAGRSKIIGHRYSIYTCTHTCHGISCYRS